MKCQTKDCPDKAEYAKVGEDTCACEKHAPIVVPALHDLDELPAHGWDHTDALVFCASCEKWWNEDDAKACESCQERACDDCLDENGECGACKDSAEARADQDYNWRHR